MLRQSPQERRSVSGSSDKSPIVAMLLGIIPGLGAAYNGQNIKALVHFAVIVGMWQMADVLDLFFFTVAGAALYLYSIYDARRSALRLRRGEDLTEEDNRLRSFLREHTLLWGAALVVVGVLSILNVYTPWRMHWLWPLLLVAAGCFVLYGRIRSRREAPRTPFVTPPPSVITTFDSSAGDYARADLANLGRYDR
jgi:TM2 domain-containing membrane protein YozV